MTNHKQAEPIGQSNLNESSSINEIDQSRPWLHSLTVSLNSIWWLIALSPLMSTAAVAMLIAAIFTLFRKRRFYSEVIARWLGRMALWSAGVKLIVHQESPLTERQRVYISNHTSTLDAFIVIAIGLPNTRYFMKGSFQRNPALAIIGNIIGNFFTPPQSQPLERIACFRKAEDVLRRTGESVYLSPEGTRIVDGTIGPFNKGAFHLATNLLAPIVPLYIDIPPAINPGKGYGVIPGVVHIYFLPEINTEAWTLDNLHQNKERIRNLYMQVHKKLRRTDSPE